MHCNIVKNDYQHTSKFYLLLSQINKQLGQSINISPHSLSLMNTVNKEFSYIEVWFTDQVSKALEIEDNVNLTLIIGVNIIKMRYSTETKYRKYVEGYGFLLFAGKFGDKYGNKLMDTAAKKGIDAAKTAFKRAVQKTAEATGDLSENKITDKITSLDKPKEKTMKEEEIYIPLQKRQPVIEDLKLF